MKTTKKQEEEQLNELALAYYHSTYENERNDLFTDMYLTFKSYMKNKIHWIAKDIGNGDIHDVEAAMEDTFFNVVEKYNDQHDFMRLLTVSIRNKKIELIRKEKKQKNYRAKQTMGIMKNGEEVEIFDILEDEYANVEDLVIEKEASDKEKEKLIEFFEQMTDDPETKAIIRAYSKYKNMSQVASSLGLHNQTVKRKLERLKRLYDEQKFGNYKDYLRG